jgi:hypothetical protein
MQDCVLEADRGLYDRLKARAWAGLAPDWSPPGRGPPTSPRCRPSPRLAPAPRLAPPSAPDRHTTAQSGGTNDSAFVRPGERPPKPSSDSSSSAPSRHNDLDGCPLKRLRTRAVKATHDINPSARRAARQSAGRALPVHEDHAGQRVPELKDPRGIVKGAQRDVSGFSGIERENRGAARSSGSWRYG